MPKQFVVNFQLSHCLIFELLRNGSVLIAFCLYIDAVYTNKSFSPARGGLRAVGAVDCRRADGKTPPAVGVGYFYTSDSSGNFFSRSAAESAALTMLAR
jgi:hypothetical protein